MINNKVVVSTPGKVILLGEHAVVYGKPAISMAINRRSMVKVEKSNYIEVISDKYGKRKFSPFEIEKYGRKIDFLLEKKLYDKIKQRDSFDPIEYELYHIFNYYSYDNVRITINSEVGKNLGSSSSVAVGIAAALEKYFSNSSHFSIDEVISFANSADVIAHGGTPSGVDAATIAVGKSIYFLGSYYENIRLGLEEILIVDSGEPSKTSETVSKVRKLVSNREYKEKIDRLGEIVDEVRKGRDIKDAMLEYYKVLREFGISTSKLDEIVEIALKEGGVGKPTGGWGGGYCIVIGDKKVKDYLISKGFNLYKVKIDEGIKFLM